MIDFPFGFSSSGDDVQYLDRAGRPARVSLRPIPRWGSALDFLPVKPTEAQVAYVRGCMGRLRRLPQGRCFSNAQQLVLDADQDRRLTYAEGMVKTDGVPVLHGWNLLDNSIVVDVTLRRKPGGGRNTVVIGTWMDGRAYRGVTFSDEEVEASVYGTRLWQSILLPYPPTR